MAQGKSSTARRREVRRNLPKAAAGWRVMLRRPEVGWAVLYAAVFAVVATVIAAPLIDRSRPMQLGQAVEKTLTSRVNFAVVDLEATQLDRRFAAEKIPPHFVADQRAIERLRFELQSLPASLQAFKDYSEMPPALIDSLGMQLAVPSPTENATERAEREKRNTLLAKKHQAALDTLRAFADPTVTGGKGRWDRLTDDIINGLLDTPILTETQRQRYVKQYITLHYRTLEDGTPAERDKTSRAVINIENKTALDGELEELTARVPVSARDAVFAFMKSRIAPTYTYSKSLTESARDTARQAVPERIETIAAGIVLAQPGDKVTQAVLDRVLAEERAYLATRSAPQRWLPRAAMLALMLIVAAGLWVYFFAYCPRLVRNPMRGMAITALMLLCMAAAVSSSLVWPDFIIGSLTFPVLCAATVLAIAYDQRFALAMGVALSMIVVIILKLPLATAFIVIVGVAAAVMQLREIRTRSKLVIVGTYAGLAMGVTAAVVGLAVKPVLEDGVVQTVLVDALAAITSGFFTGLLVQGALPLIERAFNVTTAMTLKELNDVSHPLLQRLAHEAPGTYQHSLRIADMAEAAAEAVDADALLCRVGAMYHDIGKTNKPDYFIENQGGGPNKHAKLRPAMSLLIIVGHVKDGVEMAREFGLPAVIRHFIESHHGTTLVEYFYHEAKKQTEAEDKPSPSEFEFRYPGPKPTSREAAIMMLCDCVEGAARAMDEPTATRLENLVKSMASKRLMDGQFDDCDMTLQDLSRIEQAITKSLCAMYHQRIKYPEDKKLSDTPAAKTAAG